MWSILNLVIWSWVNLYLFQGWCCSSRHLGCSIGEEWYASWLACAWHKNGWNLNKGFQVEINFRNLLAPFFCCHLTDLTCYSVSEWGNCFLQAFMKLYLCLICFLSTPQLKIEIFCLLCRAFRICHKGHEL